MNSSSFSSSSLTSEEASNAGDSDIEKDDLLVFHPLCFHENKIPQLLNLRNKAAHNFQIFPKTIGETVEMDIHQYNFDMLQFLPMAEDDDFVECTIVLINRCRLFVKELSLEELSLDAADGDDGGDGGDDSYEKQKKKDQRIGTLLTQHLFDVGYVVSKNKAVFYPKNNNNNCEEEEEEIARFYRPVLKDDDLLCCIDDVEDLQRDRMLKIKRMEELSDGTITANIENKDRMKSVVSINNDNVHPIEQVAVQQPQQKVAIFQTTETILRERIFELEKKLANAERFVTILFNNNNESSGNGNNNNNSNNNNATKNQKTLKDNVNVVTTTVTVTDNDNNNNDKYFESYERTCIHEEMINDRIRTNAYRDAILRKNNNTNNNNNENNDYWMKDKTVLEVGCGTGILSIFAAQAGARKVVAVEASDMAGEAERIILNNHYDDVVTVVRGRIEDVIIPSSSSSSTTSTAASKNTATTTNNTNNNNIVINPNETFDVIISEWMGYALFFETMLPSVLHARDLLMTPNTGTMMPNQCAIYVEGAKDSRIDFWNDVYGIDMSVMGDRVRKELANNNDIVGGTSSSSATAGSTGKKTDVECSVTTVRLEDVTTSKAMLQSWDLNTCLDSDLDFVSSFRLLPKLLPTTNTSSSGSNNDEINDNGKKEDDDNCNDEEKSVILLDRLVISFDVTFNPPTTIITDSRNDKKNKVPSLQPPIILDTGCSSPRTHWQQTTLHLNANNSTTTNTATPTTTNNNNGNDNEDDHHAQTKKQNRIELRPNEAMYGTLRLTRGATNKREIDVFVSWGVKQRIGPNGDEDDTNNNSNNNTVDMIPSGPQWRMTGNVLGKLSAS